MFIFHFQTRAGGHIGSGNAPLYKLPKGKLLDQSFEVKMMVLTSYSALIWSNKG